MPTPSPTQNRPHVRAAWGSDARPPSRPPLTIRRSPTGFVVEDPALMRLAGLGPLPLPFTPDAAPDKVLAHLRRLNPHRTVRFDDTNPCTLDEDTRLSSHRTGAQSPHRSP